MRAKRNTIDMSQGPLLGKLLLFAAPLALTYLLQLAFVAADMVVIEGPLAGGHLGFSKEEAENLSREEYEGTICKIIRLVKEYALKYGKKIPIVVAGGTDNFGKGRC